MKLNQIRVLELMVLASLCGCTVGPNYKRPEMEMSQQFGEVTQTTSSNPATQPSRLVGQTAPLAQWWRAFRDPELDRLVADALSQNLDLQIATARLRQARAQRNIAKANLFPQIDADAGYVRSRGSENVTLPFGSASSGGQNPNSVQSPSGTAGAKGRSPRSATLGDPPNSNSPGATTDSAGGGGGFNNELTPFGKGGLPGVTTDLYQVGFDANWELDVFGGTRRRIEAATADLTAALENRHDVQITLLAEVARTYLELRGAQQLLVVAGENLEAQGQILELTRSMNKAGLNSELDVTRATAQAATIASTIPPLEAQARQAIHALSTLLAREPNALSAELRESKPVPPSPPDVPVGMPSDLLRRRPDIRRAERQIAAATARIGEAKADLFPKFTLTGSAGLDSTSIEHLFDWQSRYFLISPTVTWRIFDAGRIASNIALQKANQDEATLQYQRTILMALQEVEDALVAYATEQTRRTALAEAVNQGQLSLRLARNQYEHGLVEFLAVLDAQRNVLAEQDALARSNQSVATDLVALYKALGGGWEDGIQTTSSLENR